MPEQRPDGPRDDFAGPEAGPEVPYPIKLRGPVIKGFGRGSRELGIPTANIPPSGLDAYPDLQSGVYFGFVGLKVTPETTQPADNSALTLSSSSGSRDPASVPTPKGNATGGDGSATGVGVYPAVLSIGYNPFYKNAQRSIEIHVLHAFPTYNFYHSALNLLILGFIRPEYDYNSLEALVDDIKCDCDVARRSLARESYAVFGGDGDGGESRAGTEADWLRDFEWWKGVEEEDVRRLEERETGAGGEGGKL